MKIVLAQDKLFEDVQYSRGDTVDVTDDIGAYHVSMGSASVAPEEEPPPETVTGGDTLSKAKKKATIDKLDEAVDKDNPFHLGRSPEGDDDLPVSKKSKK